MIDNAHWLDDAVFWCLAPDNNDRICGWKYDTGGQWWQGIVYQLSGEQYMIVGSEWIIAEDDVPLYVRRQNHITPTINYRRRLR
jgi:hypothetical protein